MQSGDPEVTIEDDTASVVLYSRRRGVLARKGRLYFWSLVWVLVSGVFVLLGAGLVGLSIYAVIMFGLWWPTLIGVHGWVQAVLAAVTMLPFMFLFQRMNWSRPWDWLAARFAALLAPIDRRIAALREAG